MQVSQGIASGLSVSGECSATVVAHPRLDGAHSRNAVVRTQVGFSELLTLFESYSYDSVSAGIWVIPTYRWQIWG